MGGLSRAFTGAHVLRNPFGEPRSDERALLVVPRLPLPGPGEKFQVVAEAGAGKTSALLALRLSLERAARSVVSVWTPADGVVHIPDGDAVLLVDEAQRLRDRRALRRELEQTGPRAVVVASHEVISTRVPVVALPPPDIELLEAIVTARLAWARRGHEPPARPPRALLQALLERHPRNLRAVEHALYEWFQQRWG